MGSSQRRPHRPVSAPAETPTSQVLSQQIAPWAGFILSRPGEVWVPGASIPGEAGSQPGPLLVNLCGRPETASFSHPHRWTSDGCQPALPPSDTTRRPSLAMTAVGWQPPPIAAQRAVTRHGPCTPPGGKAVDALGCAITAAGGEVDGWLCD